MPIRKRSVSASVGESYLTGNILNGVLNCAWNKTSAEPKLLEIANTSEVKFNIDTLNPLVLRFADGWDDNDRPKGIIKQLSTPPPNINLSSKANCHVQIVAKVVNGELTITTHDIYDPLVGYGSTIIPQFTDANPKNGWSVSATSKTEDVWKLFDRNDSTSWTASSYPSIDIFINAPGYIYINQVRWCVGQTNMNINAYGWNADLATWEKICGENYVALNWRSFPLNPPVRYSQFKINTYRATNVPVMKEIELYESPTAKFYRSLNKVKDRSDNERLWINLGYATMDESGNITALNHYTDLRNNYPGGMRVEP